MSSDADREDIEVLIRLAVPRVFRDRTDPLDIVNDDEFRKLFRLSRRGFFHVLSMVSSELTPSTLRSASISSAHKLSIFLETIGSGNLQVHCITMRNSKENFPLP